MADTVMRIAEPGAVSPAPVEIQRKCSACEDEEEKIQRSEDRTRTHALVPQRQLLASGGAVPARLERELRGMAGGGRPLASSARAFFEPRFGFDFSRVRVHSGGRAAELARSLRAEAFTMGRDIVLGAGAGDTPAGRRLMAHELTHVIQQSGARGQASGDGVAGADGLVQRSISPELDKIEGLLSYGVFDWAITDSEAIRALELLKGMPKHQQATFFSEPKYAGRLRSNLPSSRIPELDQLEAGVADIRPPTADIEDINSRLSYGLFDWAVTDADATSALDKLKKLPDPQLSVALGAINYGRLLDNLPDSRKQELVDLMAKHMATGGTRTKEEEAHPGTILSSIKFTSDHGVMKDNTKEWSNGGVLYGEPEWFIDAKNKTVSKPISHTKDSNIALDVALNILPLTAPDAPVTLRGDSDGDYLRFNHSGTLRGGLSQSISLVSAGKLPDQVTALPDKEVVWTMKWQGWEHEIGRTRHSIFVTMDTPLVPAEVTYKRMAKAIDIVMTAPTYPSLAPHDVVRGIMKNWNVYNLTKVYPNAWDLADNIAEGAQCIDIVRFVQGILQTIGCPGTSEAVVVWADPASAGVPLEAPWGSGGMFFVAPNAAHADWRASLLDGDWHANNFEAALKFNHGGTLAYYPGGVDAVLHSPLEVLHVFKCVAWLKQLGAKRCRIMEVPAGGDYPSGPCLVGSEHQCSP